MATSFKSPPITVEQYERFEGYPGLRDELIYGEIVMSPQPKPFHQQIAENIQHLVAEVLAWSVYVVKQNSNIKFAEANSMPAPDVFVVLKADWIAACENHEYLAQPPVPAVGFHPPTVDAGLNRRSGCISVTASCKYGSSIQNRRR